MITFFAILLTVLFVGLKLTGVIAWSWLWVLMPVATVFTTHVLVFLTLVAIVLLAP